MIDTFIDFFEILYSIFIERFEAIHGYESTKRWVFALFGPLGIARVKLRLGFHLLISVALQLNVRCLF